MKGPEHASREARRAHDAAAGDQTSPTHFPINLRPDQRSAQRHIPLKNVVNLRDLGGYRTSDGRAVRWGALYRSGDLHRLTNDSKAALAALGLEAIVDFRTSEERERAPHALPEDLAMRIVELPILDTEDSDLATLVREAITNGTLGDHDPDEMMRASYVSFVTQFSEQYRRFAHIVLLAEGRPVLYHCTAGKDRTGFASALLLGILGVPRETIVTDYMLSAQHAMRRDPLRLLLLRLLKGRVTVRFITRMMSVDESWIHAALDAIDREHGTFDHYLRDALGLSAGDRERMRLNLLAQP